MLSTAKTIMNLENVLKPIKRQPPNNDHLSSMALFWDPEIGRSIQIKVACMSLSFCVVTNIIGFE